ncbi:hypothetical protein PDIG_05090 [Penicillium digitatum PHI26]|uniref:Uncharacterized protein n=2 Tax=Penicillium digitatum TaxID=36651 RepID=K9GCV9_PEND2|nr:hypothetical protein PDIP_09760 [Penicillium digitatum Pd1]EKV19012.1 hypothetical protein PDIG_05090 [Penicillium digitatum PHI26]EKV21150.1 hypothetical protein PDIP_09760 [Penicillium digitatum Pd1]
MPFNTFTHPDKFEIICVSMPGSSAEATSR